MNGATSYTIDDVLPEDKRNDTYLAFVIGYETDKNGGRSSATARLIAPEPSFGIHIIDRKRHNLDVKQADGKKTCTKRSKVFAISS